MRKNAKAKSWVAKKIGYLQEEGVPHKQAVATALAMARKHGLIKNDGEQEELADSFEDAQEVARGFHGRPNQETIELEESEQYRENQAILGCMEEIELLNLGIFDEDGLEPIEFSPDVLLTCSSDRKQLFLMGDMSLPDEWLKKMSSSGWDKDKVILGNAYSISYFADKHHLSGPKQQKKGSSYGHCFGEAMFSNPKESRNGLMESTVWKPLEKLAAGCLPAVVYDQLNEKIELIGGNYIVKDEGIYD